MKREEGFYILLMPLIVALVIVRGSWQKTDNKSNQLYVNLGVFFLLSFFLPSFPFPIFATTFVLFPLATASS